MYICKYICIKKKLNLEEIRILLKCIHMRIKKEIRTCKKKKISKKKKKETKKEENKIKRRKNNHEKD
jgi:hypothetical protein